MIDVVVVYLEVVEKFIVDYEVWWKSVLVCFDEYVRIDLGYLLLLIMFFMLYDWYFEYGGVFWN